jgi:NAD+ kinase
MPEPRKIRSVGIAAKPRLQTAAALISQLTEWLATRQILTLLDCETAGIIRQADAGIERSQLPALCDLIIVLGGDGTLLSVARLLETPGKPILAVNFGSLGFLTEITLGEVFSTLESFLEGKLGTQKRMMIEGEVVRGGEVHSRFRALNDAVLTKGAISRIIDIDVQINRHFVATYKADGLIVSTPTGSTAYALSAGGPIIDPSLDAMQVTPIASHTLTFRSLVIPDTAVVEMSLKPTQESVFLTVDGQEGLPLVGEDRVRIRKSPASIELIESPSLSFFDILRQKLKWGER